MRRLRDFTLFFACSFAATAGIYLLTALFRHTENGRSDIFGSLFRMPAYHNAHPFQYIALVCLCYALAAACFAPVMGRPGCRARLSAVGVVFSAPPAASLPGGMLWKYHDMLAGFFPSDPTNYLLDGLWLGLKSGWLIVLLSAPYALICAVPGVIGTLWLSRRLYPAKDAKAPKEKEPFSPFFRTATCYICLLCAAGLIAPVLLEINMRHAAALSDYRDMYEKGTAAQLEHYIDKHHLDINGRPWWLPRRDAGGAPPLSLAAVNPDPDVLRLLLRRGAALAPGPFEESFDALEKALKAGRTENALILLEARASSPVRPGLGLLHVRWPLVAYCSRASDDGNEAKQIRLLQAFADAGMFSKNIFPPHVPMRAAETVRDGKLFAFLQQAGACEPQQIPELLSIAAMKNPHPELTLFFLENGGNPNMIYDERLCGVTGMPLLACSLFSNANIKVPEALLTAGADPNAKSTDGRTLLMLLDTASASAGNAECPASRVDNLLARRTLLLKAGAVEYRKYRR